MARTVPVGVNEECATGDREVIMAYDIQQVINMSQDELDKLFSSGEVGEIPAMITMDMFLITNPLRNSAGTQPPQ